jgi:hypothetical protein
VLRVWVPELKLGPTYFVKLGPTYLVKLGAYVLWLTLGPSYEASLVLRRSSGAQCSSAETMMPLPADDAHGS